MVRRGIRIGISLILLVLPGPSPTLLADQGIRFSAAERAMILAHGPWPPAPTVDPSNRFSANAAAMDLGRQLFFDSRLSAGGRMSCGSCHLPGRAMTDGLARAAGRGRLDRNTPAVANLAGLRWYGWAGASDTLWGQSIRPLLDAREMALDAAELARLIRDDPIYARRYHAVTGQSPGVDSDAIVQVNVGKLLAAWQETLVTPVTAFDRFRDDLAAGRETPVQVFSLAARRGLKRFVGEGRCSLCHFGPRFSNDEFHPIGLGHFVDGGRVDPGRHGGLRRYRQSPFNRSGPHSDEPAESAAAAPGNFVSAGPDDWGTFRVPSLRNVGRTAPYMHDGSLPDLEAVMQHYNDLPTNRLHMDGESLLRPLGLDAAALADIIAFLRSLDGDPVETR